MAYEDRWRNERDRYFGRHDNDRDRYRSEDRDDRGARDFGRGYGENYGQQGRHDYGRGEQNVYGERFQGQGRYGRDPGGRDEWSRGYGGDWSRNYGADWNERGYGDDFGPLYGAEGPTQTHRGYGRDSNPGGYGREPGRSGMERSRYQGYDRFQSSDRHAHPERNDDRGFMERAGDEIASWFGDHDAERRRDADTRRNSWDAQHRGRGPRGYNRSDDRLREDINDRLTDDRFVDASDIEVTVSKGEVTLTGQVENRHAKRRAEDIAEAVSGVTHVQNNLRMRDAAAGSTTAGASAMAGAGRTGALGAGQSGAGAAGTGALGTGSTVNRTSETNKV